MAGEHFPSLSPRGWEALLRGRFDPALGPPGFRLIRSDGGRAVVEVGHRSMGTARTAWNGPLPQGGRLATVRTWGTLVGAKRWLATRRRPG